MASMAGIRTSTSKAGLDQDSITIPVREGSP